MARGKPAGIVDEMHEKDEFAAEIYLETADVEARQLKISPNVSISCLRCCIAD